MIEKNSIIFGILIGVLTPIVGFIIIETIFDLLIKQGIMADVTASISERRFRSMTLFALCFTLIPIHIAKNNRWDLMMRGMVFPILIYGGAWVIKFFL
ncbi:MAG: hypothetical protein H6567_07985 [Lewinellaceae bacterium]|nr:hypothetical protein [Lewinellaceae bacterium]